jgi:hypothetical protein
VVAGRPVSRQTVSPASNAICLRRDKPAGGGGVANAQADGDRSLDLPPPAFIPTRPRELTSKPFEIGLARRNPDRLHRERDHVEWCGRARHFLM